MNYTDENGMDREINSNDNEFMTWTDAYQIVTYLLRWQD